MVVDESIEKFANSIFKYLYYESEALSKPDNYVEPNSEVDHFIAYAVLSRQEVFGYSYRKEFRLNYDTWKNSENDFYEYLCKLFSDFKEYLDPNVFDKILIVCSFIQEIGIVSCYRGNDIYLKFPFIFAKYFDNWLKDEFFSEGGWKALENHCGKYRMIIQYMFDIVLPNGTGMDQKSFNTCLIARLKKDYHFEYLLSLLKEQISKRENDSNICRKCAAIKNFSIESILVSELDDLTPIETIFQICLKLKSPQQLMEFNKKVAGDLEHHHTNCKTKTTDENTVKVDFLEPCLKCYIPINTIQTKHSGQRKINSIDTKPNFLRKAASQEVIKTMLANNHHQVLKSQNGCYLCACCSEKLKSQSCEYQFEMTKANKSVLRQCKLSNENNSSNGDKDQNFSDNLKDNNVSNVLQNLHLEAKVSPSPTCRKRKQ